MSMKASEPVQSYMHMRSNIESTETNEAVSLLGLNGVKGVLASLFAKHQDGTEYLRNKANCCLRQALLLPD